MNILQRLFHTHTFTHLPRLNIYICQCGTITNEVCEMCGQDHELGACQW